MNFSLGDFELTLNFLRNVSSTGKGLSETLERLSSGVKVSGALDEGASAIVQLSGSYKRDSAVLAQAASNVNQSISQLNHAEAGLVEAENILKRMDELAASVEAGASGEQLTAIQTEFNNLKSSYNNIINNTQLPDGTASGGQNVFAEGGNHELSTQAGYGAENTIEYTIGEELGVTTGSGGTTTVTGTFSLTSTGDFDQAGTSYAQVIVSGDFDEDGHLDVVTGVDNTVDTQGLSLLIGNGDGTFEAYSEIPLSANPTVYSLIATDIDNDSHLDLAFSDDNGSYVIYGNGDGNFTAKTTFSTTGSTTLYFEDVNNDGYEDRITSINASYTLVALGNSDGTFQAEVTTNLQTDTNEPQSIAVGTLDAGGAVDIVAASNGGIQFATGNNDGSFNAPTLIDSGIQFNAISIADVNGDGKNDIIASDPGNRIKTYLGNGDGTFQAPTTLFDNDLAFSKFELTDIDNDNDLDLVVAGHGLYTFTNDGTGTFGSKTTIGGSDSHPVEIADFDEDGENDIFVVPGGNGYEVLTADTTSSGGSYSTQRTFDSGDTVDSVSDASDVRTVISGFLDGVTNEQGNIDALQTRFTSTVSILAQTSQNFQSASNRITNIDVATELGDFIAKSIVSDSQTAISAQVMSLNLSAVDLLKDSLKKES